MTKVISNKPLDYIKPTNDIAVFPPPADKKPLPLNTVSTQPLDKVWAEPTPRK